MAKATISQEERTRAAEGLTKGLLRAKGRGMSIPKARAVATKALGQEIPAGDWPHVIWKAGGVVRVGNRYYLKAYAPKVATEKVGAVSKSQRGGPLVISGSLTVTVEDSSGFRFVGNFTEVILDLARGVVRAIQKSR